MSLVVVDDTANEIVHEKIDRCIIRHKMTVIFNLSTLTWIHTRFKVSLLSIILERLVKITHWQPIIHDITGILKRHLEKLFEVFVIWLFL